MLNTSRICFRIQGLGIHSVGFRAQVGPSGIRVEGQPLIKIELGEDVRRRTTCL